MSNGITPDSMQDWLGQEIRVGDYVIYSTGGRSVQMILATVVRFNDSGSVTVQPVSGSRWGRRGNSWLMDSRTGKRFISWDKESEEHQQKPSHWAHTVTGEEIDPNTFWSKTFSERDEYRYVPVEWKDYVVEGRDRPKPVVISVTENLTKWTGVLPPDE